jgi:mono/diheme cytochrome c family protein
MYSNGVRVTYRDRINQQGYLAHSMWTWNGDRAPMPSSYSRGEAIFRGECASCHTLNGYRPLKTLLAGRDRGNIGNFLAMLHDYKPDSPYRKFMPPLVGTNQDLDDLANFLNSQVNPAATTKPLLTATR